MSNRAAPILDEATEARLRQKEIERERAERERYNALMLVLGRIAGAIEAQNEIHSAILSAITPAPDYVRSLAEYNGFDWPEIGAEVKQSDERGPTVVSWGGFVWLRRSPDNKFDEAIWFSRMAHKGDEKVWLRLITFKDFKAEPMGRKAERKVG